MRGPWRCCSTGRQCSGRSTLWREPPQARPCSLCMFHRFILRQIAHRRIDTSLSSIGAPRCARTKARRSAFALLGPSGLQSLRCSSLSYLASYFGRVRHFSISFSASFRIDIKQTQSASCWCCTCRCGTVLTWESAASPTRCATCPTHQCFSRYKARVHARLITACSELADVLAASAAYLSSQSGDATEERIGRRADKVWRAIQLGGTAPYAYKIPCV